MLNIAQQKDIGSFITSRNAIAATAVTAGGTGDATEINGIAIDRLVAGAGGPLLSAKLVIAVTAVLGQDETITIAANAQDDDVSAFSGTPADLDETLAAAVVATGGAGGSTESAVAELDFNLAGARQYLRAQVTPNMSAANTDTATVTAVWIFGGTDDYPAA